MLRRSCGREKRATYCCLRGKPGKYSPNGRGGKRKKVINHCWYEGLRAKDFGRLRKPIRKLVFNRVLESLFVERMGQNEDIFARFMNEQGFQKLVAAWLVSDVYKKLQSPAA
jgi:hypothetical protein